MEERLGGGEDLCEPLEMEDGGGWRLQKAVSYRAVGETGRLRGRFGR